MKQGKRLLNELMFHPNTNLMPINTPTISVAKPRPSVILFPIIFLTAVTNATNTERGEVERAG
jgi:hypothetical protein